MAPEVMQQMIKRGGAIVLVFALAVGGYFAYDIMTSSSSEDVVTQDWEERDNLDDFLASQTGAATVSGLTPSALQTGLVGGSGGTIAREGEVVSNIIVGSGEMSADSGETIGSGDEIVGGTGEVTVEDVFDQLLVNVSFSGQENLSGSMNGILSGTLISSTSPTSGSGVLSGQTEGGNSGSGSSLVGVFSVGQSGSLIISGLEQYPSGQLTGMSGTTTLPSLFRIDSQSVTGVQTRSTSLLTTFPVSDELLMEHYRQRKNNNR
ncbi:MAG: hypothetical protein NZL83_00940 [Candidatus Absconditabacterales bacterium]|nr:hypothetical protein [Candidatus Absconditabacterales bacterium]